MANLTLAQMLALLPDNTTGQIDAVNVRDIVTALFERTDGTTAIPALQFDTAGVVDGPTGHIHWDADANTLALEVDVDGTLQIGHENYLLALNTTGSTILNGRAVQIVGGSGDNALIDLDDGLGTIVGIATEDILNGAVGRVTTFGVVHDVDTSAFTAGDPVYATTGGALIATQTGSLAGYVLFADATAGRVFVRSRGLAVAGGPTANRPAPVPIGFQYYDTDLSAGIWWDGTQWVDYSGSPV